MSHTTHQRRNTEGACLHCGCPERITQTLCIACAMRQQDYATRATHPDFRGLQQHDRQQKAHATFLAALAEPDPVAPRRHEVGCCGRWHRIITVPFPCPICQRVFCYEEAVHA